MITYGLIVDEGWPRSSTPCWRSGLTTIGGLIRHIQLNEMMILHNEEEHGHSMFSGDA